MYLLVGYIYMDGECYFCLYSPTYSGSYEGDRYRIWTYEELRYNTITENNSKKYEIWTGTIAEVTSYFKNYTDNWL